MTRLTNIGTTDYPPEDTAIIILGDAGINFWLNKTDRNLKRNIQNTGFTLYCVRGNHEERPENLPNIRSVYDQNIQGTVFQEDEYPNIRYLKDGGEYDINGSYVLCIGGAYSVDKWYRLNRAGVTDKLHPDYTNSKKTGWFPTEQLTSEEMGQIELNTNGNFYDVILTHTCPESWEPRDLFLSGLDQSTVDKSMEKWLDNLKDNIKWGIWLWGHYHSDRIERPHCEMYYQNIEDLKTIQNRWFGEKTFKKEWWLQKAPNFYMKDNPWAEEI